VSRVEGAAAAVAPPEFMRAEVLSCGDCKDEGEIVLVCRECGKRLCRECVLDDELGAQMCWMCIDWTPRGRSFKQSVARRRHRER
jgi:hypothetical protein